MMEGSGERKQQTTGTDKNCTANMIFPSPLCSLFTQFLMDAAPSLCTKAKTNRPDSLLFQHYLGANLMKVATESFRGGAMKYRNNEV